MANYTLSYTGAQTNEAIGTIRGLTGTTSQYAGFNSSGKPIAKSADATPTQNSSALITSGAVYNAIIGAIGGSY